MESSKHTCISCAYLCQFADKFIDISYRGYAVDDKMWNSKYVSISYTRFVCYKVQLQSFTNVTNEQARNIIIAPNKCKYWVQYISGISPIATEQRESSKWSKWAFWVITTTLLVAIATLVVTLITCDS